MSTNKTKGIQPIGEVVEELLKKLNEFDGHAYSNLFDALQTRDQAWEERVEEERIVYKKLDYLIREKMGSAEDTRVSRGVTPKQAYSFGFDQACVEILDKIKSLTPTSNTKEI